MEYSFYKEASRETFEKLFAIFIVIINLLIIQSMLFDVGVFGNLFVEALKPHIGIIGLSLLVISVFVLVLFILKIDILQYIKHFDFNSLKNIKIKLPKASPKTPKQENKIVEVEIDDTPIIDEEAQKKEEIENYIKSKLKEVRLVDDSDNIEKSIKQTSQKIQKEVEVPKEEIKEEVEIPKEEIKEEVEIPKEEIKEEVETPKEEIKEEIEIPKEEIKEEVEIPKEEIKEEVETPKEEIKEEVETPKEEIKEEIEIPKEEIKEEVETQQEPLEQSFSIKEIEDEIPNTSHLQEEKAFIVKELDENKELLKDIEIGEQEKPKDFVLPSVEFLAKPPHHTKEINEEEIDAKVQLLLDKLKNFKIEGDVVRTSTGPLVTTFEFKPLPHIKVSKILNLEDDLAMALKASTIRIQAPIPGKDVVGIEIPNSEIETIYLREILEDDIFKTAKSPLVIALGKDIVGNPFVTDLAKLPHLLIAGTTGSGKSVGINSMILSLLYRNSPDDLKLMMIDPKMLEFSIYNDIPHLLTPVITEPKKAIAGLNNMVKEMERRYKLLSQARVKNIENYNTKNPDKKLPYIVVIIDELADLMMTGGKDVEYSIVRLTQMARASGIHLIVATQRPSVDVVTGLIKTNMPSRISFKVGQKIDSKVILDQFGAESLLGRGDMLFTPGSGKIIRLHAPFTSEEEIEKIVEFLKSQRSADYDENFLAEEVSNGSEIDNKDELYEEAKQIILNEGKTSISYLQRRLQIGYNRAANIIEQLEFSGVLSSPNSKGQREILI